MKVSVKFFCSCDAYYLEEVFTPDIEPVERVGPSTYQECHEVAMCQECYKVHEIQITQYPDGHILVWIPDVDGLEYKVLPDESEMT